MLGTEQCITLFDHYCSLLSSFLLISSLDSWEIRGSGSHSREGRSPAVSVEDKKKVGGALQVPKCCVSFISGCLQTDLRGRNEMTHILQEKKKINKAKQKLFLVVIKWGWQWCRDVIGKASCCHCWLGVFAQFFKRELLPRTKIVSPELGISPWMNPSPRKAPGPLLPCLRQPAFTSQSLSQGVGQSLHLLSETDSPHKSHLDQELRCEAQNS